MDQAAEETPPLCMPFRRPYTRPAVVGGACSSHGTGQPGNAQMLSLGLRVSLGLRMSLGLRNRSRAVSGWVDTHKVELSGPNGGPVRQDIRADINLEALSDDELALFEALLIKTSPQLASQM